MKQKLTVYDLLACKGVRPVTITTAFDQDTAAACEKAGIDILLTWSKTMNSMDELRLRLREVCASAPSTMIGAALPISAAYASETEAVRCAYETICSGGNLIYASGMEMAKYRALGREKIPCVGHVGLVPFQSTWIGGLKAVGKTADEATAVYQMTLAYQEAGCVAVEMECVPERVAQYIASKVDLMVFSMGSGPFCDGQFLFTSDILGTNSARIPRHAVRYRDLQREMVNAMTEFRQDVESGAFPPQNKVIQISDHEFDGFLKKAETLG